METELMAMVVRNATDQRWMKLGEITEILMKKVWANERDTEEDKAFHEKIYQMVPQQGILCDAESTG